VLAWALTIALLSLAGIPPTAGFSGKLEVFRAGVASGFEWLVVIGVLSSVIAAFFYLRIIGAMFLEEPDADAEAPLVPDDLNIGISLAAAAVVFLGIQPQLVLDIATRTAQLAQ
jgi:NADH-quinone oxidoreductase subunit N